MQPNGIIFWDWNGTLLDDVDFTHGCLNWMLETHGYPQRYDLAEYREIFGFPIEEYYLRAKHGQQAESLGHTHLHGTVRERLQRHAEHNVQGCHHRAAGQFADGNIIFHILLRRNEF